MSWMLRPRHERAVWTAAHRAGYLDERALLDDWAMHWLQRTRREALAAGHAPEEIDDWTMSAIARGREEARNHR